MKCTVGKYLIMELVKSFHGISVVQSRFSQFFHTAFVLYSSKKIRNNTCMYDRIGPIIDTMQGLVVVASIHSRLRAQRISRHDPRLQSPVTVTIIP